MKYFIFFLFCFLGTILLAQDVHWSQFNDNPLYVNPANSGNFKGNNRFIANYRDQWRSVTKPFQTFSFSYDSHYKKNQNIGLGFLLLNDSDGDGKFKTFELQIMPSLRKFLTKDSAHQLISGIQLAFNHRQFTFPNFYFDEQYNGINYDENLPITEELVTSKQNNLSLGAGLLYEYRINRKQNLQLGFSAFNLNQPNQGFYGETVKRDIRLTFFSKIRFNLNQKLDLFPSLLCQIQGTYRELVFGTHLKYCLKNDLKAYKAISAGIYYRKKDAYILNLALDINRWKLGFSYDINFSNLKPASASRGGFELSLKYIISKFQPKQIQHRVCPEFI
ncbi:MAG: PorP/SprF family type IX secretion system membrane protein [Bacteroidota bacterium]